MSFKKTTFLILVFALSGLIFSCTKDVNIKIPKPDPMLVVNCLFNPDSSWKVYIGTNRNLKDTSLISYVSNADVSLYEGNDEIQLDYLGDGYYGSHLKPKVGVFYTLKATAPGYPSVEASDSIPQQFSVSSYELDTVSVVISPTNYFGTFEAGRLHLFFDNLANNKYAQIQMLTYDKDEFYYYTINDNTIQELRKIPWVSDTLITKLYLIKDIPILSKTGFEEKIREVTGNKFISYRTIEYSERTECKCYLSNLFDPRFLFAGQPPFYNIMEDFHSIFVHSASGQNIEKALFYPDHRAFTIVRNSEAWLKFFALSKSAFEFKTTYIKQQLNRENPFAQPVQVFNNIRNGLGIFAGYLEVKFRIY